MFRGEVICPQFWPKDLDYSDRDVTGIGSGASAICIVPRIAFDPNGPAKRVTMVQRTPSYYINISRLPSRLVQLARGDGAVLDSGDLTPPAWAP